MKYKYTIKTKGVFPRPFTSKTNSKENIEEITEMIIPDKVWEIVERGKKSIVEDKQFILTIEKIK